MIYLTVISHPSEQEKGQVKDPRQPRNWFGWGVGILFFGLILAGSLYSSHEKPNITRSDLDKLARLRTEPLVIYGEEKYRFLSRLCNAGVHDACTALFDNLQLLQTYCISVHMSKRYESQDCQSLFRLSPTVWSGRGEEYKHIYNALAALLPSDPEAYYRFASQKLYEQIIAKLFLPENWCYLLPDNRSKLLEIARLVQLHHEKNGEGYFSETAFRNTLRAWSNWHTSVYGTPVASTQGAILGYKLFLPYEEVYWYSFVSKRGLYNTTDPTIGEVNAIIRTLDQGIQAGRITETATLLDEAYHLLE